MPADKHIMIMLAECEPGTEDEFNDWYSNTHLTELTRLDGFVGARRYELALLEPAQEGIQRYLAIYEIEGDVQAARDAVKGDGPNRVQAAGLDRSRSKSAYYTLIASP
jgi:hypothetical protein